MKIENEHNPIIIDKKIFSELASKVFLKQNKKLKIEKINNEVHPDVGLKCFRKKVFVIANKMKKKIIINVLNLALFKAHVSESKIKCIIKIIK